MYNTKRTLNIPRFIVCTKYSWWAYKKTTEDSWTLSPQADFNGCRNCVSCSTCKFSTRCQAYGTLKCNTCDYKFLCEFLNT